ncbi:MAG: hypothetical protein K1X61_00745 [Chitinophagales bacterium]|nr:hypothetical protein [Chitinophagales bacterium]
MKHRLLFGFVVVLVINLNTSTAFCQKENQEIPDSAYLGLPGDNLDLYAVLDLFQKSKTIEEFEKSLNLESTGVNNLDLNLDGKVDFIKVLTKNEGDDFTFILQVDVSKTEKQDVAVILVSKDKNKKVTMQIVGDKDLYGEDYIVELTESKKASVTANPGYTGNDTVVVSAPASSTTVIVEQAPIVQYVYSPAYVPYAPPYYYGYYPPYFAAFSVMAFSIYAHNHYYYHGYGGYGYHGNTTVIHNTNNFNNYNGSRNTSNTVNHNKANGSYNRNNASPGTRPSNGSSVSNRPGTSTGSGASVNNRPGTSTGGGSSVSSRPGTSSGSAATKGSSSGNRPASSAGAAKAGSSSTGTRPGTSAGSSLSKGSTSGNRPAGNYSANTRPSSNGASRFNTGGSRPSGGGASMGGARPSGGGSMGGGRSMGGGGRGAGGGRR